MRTCALPIVIEVSRLWRSLVVLEVTSMNSVLLVSLSNMEAVYKDRVINCIKCRRNVKQGLYRHVAFVKRKKVVANAYCLFQRVRVNL